MKGLRGIRPLWGGAGVGTEVQAEGVGRARAFPFAKTRVRCY